MKTRSRKRGPTINKGTKFLVERWSSTQKPAPTLRPIWSTIFLTMNLNKAGLLSPQQLELRAHVAQARSLLGQRRVFGHSAHARHGVYRALDPQWSHAQFLPPCSRSTNSGCTHVQGPQEDPDQWPQPLLHPLQSSSQAQEACALLSLALDHRLQSSAYHWPTPQIPKRTWSPDHPGHQPVIGAGRHLLDVRTLSIPAAWWRDQRSPGLSRPCRNHRSHSSSVRQATWAAK